MYLLITYDVSTSSLNGEKRLRQVARVCQNFGQRVQNSVFECLVDPAQFVTLKHQLLSIIDNELDSLRIYQLGKNYQRQISTFGKVTSYEVEGDLII
ncbi:CRISPR-associated endonuclease Cas2 [Porphyromonas sp. COT-290 OH3588]|uniref:CRISPR-associated endonuclease Cas2 n=1 Tax=Porphyromonas sp. COT-290 OH3588 TaxID=1515617 RepID=UPI00052CFEC5|nr:CRISPR-associated endonuclease Cas2 [Porphyromonas sp. COT-290 OH3588]KGO00975.1 CRISPR-associated protein Cas2 [Porphyromonas sp. COT-290 OH3588]